MKSVLSEEDIELMLKGNDELQRLEAELFGEKDLEITELEETEKELRVSLERKRKKLEEKKIKRIQLEEEERRKILEEEEGIRNLEKELLLEEAAFDRELEERRRKREETDDYDWDDVTNDPLASGSDDDKVEDEETSRIVHDNEDVKRLEAEIFGDDF